MIIKIRSIHLYKKYKLACIFLNDIPQVTQAQN